MGGWRSAVCVRGSLAGGSVRRVECVWRWAVGRCCPVFFSRYLSLGVSVVSVSLIRLGQCGLHRFVGGIGRRVGGGDIIQRRLPGGSGTLGVEAAFA